MWYTVGFLVISIPLFLLWSLGVASGRIALGSIGTLLVIGLGLTWWEEITSLLAESTPQPVLDFVTENWVLVLGGSAILVVLTWLWRRARKSPEQVATATSARQGTRRDGQWFDTIVNVVVLLLLLSYAAWQSASWVFPEWYNHAGTTSHVTSPPAPARPGQAITGQGNLAETLGGQVAGEFQELVRGVWHDVTLRPTDTTVMVQARCEQYNIVALPRAWLAGEQGIHPTEDTGLLSVSHFTGDYWELSPNVELMNRTSWTSFPVQIGCRHAR